MKVRVSNVTNKYNTEGMISKQPFSGMCRGFIKICRVQDKSSFEKREGNVIGPFTQEHDPLETHILHILQE